MVDAEHLIDYGTRIVPVCHKHMMVRSRQAHEPQPECHPINKSCEPVECYDCKKESRGRGHLSVVGGGKEVSPAYGGTQHYGSWLSRRYARWLRSTTADGTTEQQAKSKAISSRLATLYPQRRLTFWQRLLRLITK